MSKLYFAYGANINKDSMRIRCPDAQPIRPIILRDWELVFYSHASVEPKNGAIVHGVLWEITPECEESLDIYEGFPIYYTKVDYIQDDEEFFFYEMNSHRSGTPSPRYVNDINDAYKSWGIDHHIAIQNYF